MDWPPVFPDMNAHISTQQDSEDYEYQLDCSKNQAPWLPIPQESPMFKHPSEKRQWWSQRLAQQLAILRPFGTHSWPQTQQQPKWCQHFDQHFSFTERRQVAALKDTMSGFASPLDFGLRGTGDTPGVFVISIVGWLPISWILSPGGIVLVKWPVSIFSVILRSPGCTSNACTALPYSSVMSKHVHVHVHMPMHNPLETSQPPYRNEASARRTKGLRLSLSLLSWVHAHTRS